MNYAKIDQVEFPKYTGININMMPFVMGDKNSIPEEYHSYLPLIEKCLIDPDELGKVGYLSISETEVQAGKSQRRPGIHTEKHPNFGWGGGWGGGKAPLKGGLFVASNVANSCQVWDAHIEDPGQMGDCEFLKETLGEGEKLQANELVWLTDSCPHEALPVAKSTKRQWFRLVSSEVDLWYEQHSTPNRLGVEPIGRIIKGDKFNE